MYIDGDEKQLAFLGQGGLNMKVMEIGRNYYTLSGIGEIYRPQVDEEDVFSEILDAELLQLSDMKTPAGIRSNTGIQLMDAQISQNSQAARTIMDSSQRTDNSRVLAMSVLIGGMVHNASTRLSETTGLVSDESAKKRGRVSAVMGL